MILLAILGVFHPSAYYGVGASTADTIVVNISVYGTFLRAEPFAEGKPPGGSPVESPAIIGLNGYGYSGGDRIVISFDGEYYDGAFWDPDDPGEAKELDDMSMIAVFSATNQLLSIDELNRVAGAIDSGEDSVTGETHFQELPTDIPEDFRIEPHTGKQVQIPQNAEYLFLCVSDSYYPDNLGWIQVTIAGARPSFPMGLLLSILVAATVIISIPFIVLRRRRQQQQE
jgi:hypothetical protein